MSSQEPYKPRILIVDDDPDNLLLLEDDLDGIDAHIDSALSGQEALDLADQHAYAVVMMDFNMPVMDGAETTQRLDQSRLNSKTPVIFVTDAVDEKTIMRAYESGAVDYLAKGSNPTIMRAKVGVFLDLAHKTQELAEALQTIAASAQQLAEHRDHLQELVEKRTEALQIAKEQAETASRAKSEFLSMMSHELRTPINGVLGMAQVLQETELASDQQDFVDTISHSGEMLLDAVSDIIEVSELEAGMIEARSEPFNLHTLLEQLHAVLKASLADQSITPHMEVQTDLPQWYLGDGSRIRQALMTYIRNAEAHTQAGEITIRAGGNRLDNTQQYALRLEIEDTGRGIPADRLENIFEKFTQVEGGSTRGIDGVGLGLAKAQEIAQLLGGSVSVESSPGKGSIFRLELKLPVADAPAHKIQDEVQQMDMQLAADEIQDGPSTVLLAEDNPVNQVVATKILENLGYQIELAHNGSEAVDKFQRGRFAFILMDLHMPEMDGLEATQIIRQMEGDLSEHTPIIALTADALHKTQEACRAAGANEYLTKPLKIPALKTVLGKLIPKSQRPRI